MQSSSFATRPGGAKAPVNQDRIVPAKPSLAKKVTHDVIFFILIFVLIWAIPFMFVFNYHRQPATVTLFVIVMFLISLIPTKIRGGASLAAGMSCCMIFSLIFGFHLYYGHVGPMRKLMEGRVYSGMYAQAPSAAFHDGAQLRFVNDATVDTTQSTGLRTVETGLQTFCVAPVADRHSTGRVEFWAVGIDCCSGGDFECDDAGDPDAHTGFVAYDVGNDDNLYSLAKHFVPPIARRDIFKKAIAKAEADFGLTANDRPIFVSWSKLTKDEKIAEEWAAVVWKLIMAAFVALVATLVLTQSADQLVSLMSMMSELDSHVNVVRHMPTDLSPAVLEFVDEQTEEHKKNRKKTFKDHCAMVCLIPFVTLMFFVMLWSWALNFAFGYVLTVVVLVFSAILVFGMILSKHSLVHGVALLIVILVGTQIGRYNYYQNTYHYYAVKNHETYTNVQADADGGEFQDAGKLRFEDGTVLGTHKSIGFMINGKTYCAAPILTNVTNIGNSMPARVDFWAVGIDCCTESADFWCEGATDRQSQGGVVIHDTTETELKHGEDELHHSYSRAVRAAIDVNRWALPADSYPIMLRWGPDLEVIQYSWMSHSFGIILLTGASSMILFSCGSIVSYLCLGKKKQPQQGAGGP